MTLLPLHIAGLEDWLTGDTSDVFMTGVLVAAASILLAAYGLKRLSGRYPGTALARFRSTDEIRSYYRFAFDATRKRRWLISIPIWLVLSYYFLRIPTFLYGKRLLESNDWVLNNATTPITPGSIINAIGLAARELSNGQVAFLWPISPLVLILTLIIALSPPLILRKLIRWLGTQDVDGLPFLKKALTVLNSVLLLAGIPFIVALILQQPAFAIPLSFAVIGVWLATALLMVCVVRGFVLFYVRDLAGTGKADRRTALQNSLGITRPLFHLSLILAIPLSLDTLVPALLMWPSSVSTFMGRVPPASVQLPAALLIFIYYRWHYIAAFLVAALVCAPFVLVHRNIGVAGILRSNFSFVGRHFVKYVTLLFTGLVLLFLPIFFSVLTGTVVPGNTFLSLFIEMAVSAVGIYLAVVFFLAMFKFYLEYGQN